MVNRFIRSTVAVLSVAAISAFVSGCTAREQALFQKWCTSRPAMCAKVQEILGADQPPEPVQVKAETVAEAQAPAPLRAWIQERGEQAVAAAFSDDEHTYVSVAAGMQRSGGYRVELVRVTARAGGGYLVETRLVAPAPGSMVSMALTNPVAIFRLPATKGEVTVYLTPGGGAGRQSLQVEQVEKQAETFTVQTNWFNPMLLQVSGTAEVPDLHFELLAGGHVLARADAQVKDGHYVGSLQVEPGAGADLTLVVSTVEPGGGKELARVAVAPAPTDGGIIPSGEVWSDNFRVVKPVRVAPTRVVCEGKVRAFEGVFQLELWAGESLLATQSVKASDAAPNYGRFTAEFLVKGGIPEGAVVKYQLESAKDGSIITELTLPVVGE